MRHVDDVANRVVKRRVGGRKGIDWDAAERFYLSLPHPRTYGRVAAHFSVSETSVGKEARRRSWREKGRDIDREAAVRERGKLVRTRAEQIAQTARIRDAAADQIEARLTDKQLDDALVIRSFELAEKYVRLDAGEATDRVEASEVQRVIVAVYRAAGRFVPKEQRDAFVAAIDEATAGLPMLEPGGDEAVA